ncbi:MAG: tetratricopeptide repeat protein, partial [Chloroflexaceae bacterium]
ALLDGAGRHILMVMTFFPDSASGEALSATVNVTGFEFDRATERLTDLSLLDLQQVDLLSAPRYLLHPLVRAFAGARLAEQPEFERAARERWVAWYLQLVYQVWNEQRGQLEKIPLLDPEHLTVTAAMEWTLTQGLYAEASCLSNALRYYYIIRGPWGQKEYVNKHQIEATKLSGNFHEAAHAYSAHIQSLCSQKRLDEAMHWFQEMTQQLPPSSSDEEVQFWIDYTFAIVATAQQYYDIAQQKFQSCLHYVDRMPHSIRSAVRRNLAASLCHQGLWIDAEKWYHDALSIATEHSNTREIVWSRLGLVTVYIGQGRQEVATRFIGQCIEDYPNYPDLSGRGRIMQFDARLQASHGDLPAAHTALTEAIDLFERMGMRRELAEAREELARLEAQMAEEN